MSSLSEKQIIYVKEVAEEEPRVEVGDLLVFLEKEPILKTLRTKIKTSRTAKVAKKNKVKIVQRLKLKKMMQQT